MNSSQTSQPATISLIYFPNLHSDIDILDHSFSPITTRELNKTTQHLKHKSPGLSGITTHELQLLPMFSLFPNAHCHNTMSKITDSSPSSKSTASVDRILNTRLNHHLTLHDLHNDNQTGFRGCRETYTALTIFHETISNGNKTNIPQTLSFVTSPKL